MTRYPQDLRPAGTRPRAAGEHRARRTDRDLRRPAGSTSSICGLVAYQKRAGAKWAAKRMDLFDGRPARAYRCKGGCWLWHAGYLPELVVQGIVTAGEWYGYRGQPPMRAVLVPLLEKMRWTTHADKVGFERRRVEPADGDEYDLWGAMIEKRGVIYLARDYDNPTDATAAVLAEYHAARSRTDASAA